MKDAEVCGVIRQFVGLGEAAAMLGSDAGGITPRQVETAACWKPPSGRSRTCYKSISSA
jgi:hypothetical protein